MSQDTESKPASAPPLGPMSWRPAVRFVAVLLAGTLLGAVATLTYMKQGFEVGVGTDGKFTMKVASGANFQDLFLVADKEAQSSVRTILRGSDYYHATDPALADALGRLSPENDDHAAAIASLRQLLRDQRGPFVMPDTLEALDPRLIAAFGSLEAKLVQTQRTSELLIELWRQSLDYQGIFRTRMFPAQVARYPGGGGTDDDIHVYGCPGSDFIGKEVMVGTPDMRRSVWGVVVTSDFHRCGEKDQKLVHLFEGQEAQLGLSEEAFEMLFSVGGADMAYGGSADAVFQLLPKGTTSVVRLRTEG